MIALCGLAWEMFRGFKGRLFSIMELVENVCESFSLVKEKCTQSQCTILNSFLLCRRWRKCTSTYLAELLINRIYIFHLLCPLFMIIYMKEVFVSFARIHSFYFKPITLVSNSVVSLLYSIRILFSPEKNE